MGQWLSWIKSNEKALLTILDNLSKKAVETNFLSSPFSSKIIYPLDVFSSDNTKFHLPAKGFTSSLLHEKRLKISPVRMAIC